MIKIIQISARFKVKKGPVYLPLLIHDSRYMNNHIQFTPDYIRDNVIVKSFAI